MQGRAAMAFSLNNYRAARPADFAEAAAHCVHLIRAALANGRSGELMQHMAGNVVNVNLPFLRGVPPEGYHLSHMSTASVMMRFGQADEQRADAALQQHGLAASSTLRVLVAQAPEFQKCAHAMPLQTAPHLCCGSSQNCMHSCMHFWHVQL